MLSFLLYLLRIGISMNKLIIIAVFFAFLISSEVVSTALAAQAFGMCMNDATSDVETETDSEEKSEDNNKIEILVHNASERNHSVSRLLMYPKKFIFTRPYLDLTTPPPEV